MKILTTILALIGNMLFIPAQNSGKDTVKDANPEAKAKQEAAMAAKKLGLTAEQQGKWESASLIRIKSNEPYKVKLRGSTTPEERKVFRRQMKSNEDSFDQTVSAFLTDDQKTKFVKMKKERKEMRMNKRMKGMNPDGPSHNRDN